MTNNLDDSYFYMFFTIGLFSYLALTIYESILNRTKPNYLVLGACMILFASGTLGIWTFPTLTFYSAPMMDLDSYEKLKQTLSLLLFVYSIYAVIVYFVKNHPSIRRFKYLYIAIIAATYFFIIYSLVVEYDKYEMAVNSVNSIISGQVRITSLFNHCNMFAGFILMGVLASILLNYYKKNVLSYVSMFGFTIIQLFVYSLTSTLLSIAAIIIYFLAEIIFFFKKNLGLSFLKLGILLSICVAVTLTFILCQTYEVNGISSICRFIYFEFSHADFLSLTDRTTIWGAVFKYVFKSPFTALFGYGHSNTFQIIGSELNLSLNNYRLSCHNGFVQTILDYGFVGFSLLVSFFVYYFYALIRLGRKHRRFVTLFGIAGASYIALGFTESIIAFEAGAQGFLIGAFFFLPVIVKYRHLKNNESIEYLLNRYERVKLVKPELMVRCFSFIMLLAITVISSLFVVDAYRLDMSIMYILLNIIVALIAYLLTFPYLNGLWSKKGSVGKYIAHLLVFVFVNLSVIGAFTTSYLMCKEYLFQGFEWFIPGSILLTLLLYVLIDSIKYRGGTFKLYLNTFIGFKTSLGSLIGISAFTVALQSAQQFMAVNIVVTIILIVAAGFVTYLAFVLLIPFKDTRDILEYMSRYDRVSTKRGVVKDLLEEPYEI